MSRQHVADRRRRRSSLMSALSCNPASTHLDAELFPLLRGRKILFVIDEMGSITDGGTERQLLQLVNLAGSIGLLPEILVLRNTRWLTQAMAGCMVHHRSLGSLFSPSGIRQIHLIARWMRTQRFDIVQSFFSDANIVTPLLAKAAGVPCIITTRRNLHYAITPLRLRLQRIANRWTTGIVANCEAVQRITVAMEKVSASKVHVVYNGIDLDLFTPCTATYNQVRSQLGVLPSEVLVGCVSSVRPVKGVHHLVGAAERIATEHPHVKFCVVGDGPELSSLKQRTSSHPLLRERFLWPAACADVKPYLRAFDIAVLPSLSEGFSNSVLEYMAMGLPVVATDVGGNREALGTDAGVLVPAGDEKALHAALEPLLNDRAARHALGNSALERVRRWDLDAAGLNNGRYYSTVLSCLSR